jgi:hypothetical protein
MADFEELKMSGEFFREPEAAETSIERKDRKANDNEEAPADQQAASAPDQPEQPLPDPFFWPEDRSAEAGAVGPATFMQASERERIDEIMARAMRWRSVEANKIITNPTDIQLYVETCWMDELPAAQAAHAALEAAGYNIVRDSR